MDEFNNDLDLNDTTVEEFIDEFKAEVIEVIETGSAEIFIFGKKYLFEITAREVK